MASDTTALAQLLKDFSQTVIDRLPRCSLEIHTRQYLIDPYLQILGFDVHNPTHCQIEYTLPIGKRNERVDYALFIEDEPIILIEAKAASDEPLPKPLPPQLEHYFVTLKTPARFAAMTNGLTWHWYRPTPHLRLETTPFLSHDTRHPANDELQWLQHITRHAYDEDWAFEQADNLRMTADFTLWLSTELHSPSDQFLKFVLEHVQYDTLSDSPFMDIVRPNFLAAMQRFLNLPTPSLPPNPPSPKPHPVRPTLDVGDGSSPINNRMLDRAWRPPGSPWIRTKSQRQLFIDIVQHLSTVHAAGPRDFFSSATWSDGTPAFYPPTAFAKKPSPQSGYFKFNSDPDLWGWCSRQASDQRSVLTHLASVVETQDATPIRISFLKTNDEHAINPGPGIQAWCPAKTD